MNWRALDLNLLVVFDAVARERSATRAAARLNMTQPAISHALTRLRRALDDDLFLRTPEGMTPTPHAERLAGPVRQGLEMLYSALEQAAAFEPATAEGRFTLAVDNGAALTLAAPIEAALAAAAPRMRLSVRPSGTLDLAEALDHDGLDLVLGGMAALGERFACATLFKAAFVALVHKGHPAVTDAGGLSLDTLAAFPHLTLSSTGEDTSFVDAALAQHGLARTVMFHGPLLSAQAALARSDMIAVMSEGGARAFARIAPLQILALPFQTPMLATSMLWHRRMDNVPGHRWLRGLVTRVAAAL